MIVVVDGTGPDSDVEYSKEMDNSFCSQIANRAGGTYFRGPSFTGVEVSSLADKAAAAAVQLSNFGMPIALAGYSRGGCAVINAAIRLKGRGVRVSALFLFDAVDMQGSELGSTQVIPDNVDFVAHARSARSAKFWAANPVKSRWYFINTGRWLAGSGTMHEKSFVGTHGALGGVPWPDVRGDAGSALAVASWMNSELNSHGLPVGLKVIV